MSQPPITLLLRRAAEGDRAALDNVIEALYPELRRVARSRLHRQGRVGALDTTALVHEGFLRLVRTDHLRLEDRRHFFAYAAKTMRSIIIDAAREHLAERRGGGVAHAELGGDTTVPFTYRPPDEELLLVHEGLEQLQALDPELAEVVEMRYFGGYTEAEVAELQGVTERTVRRRWDKARAFLFMALGPQN